MTRPVFTLSWVNSSTTVAIALIEVKVLLTASTAGSSDGPSAGAGSFLLSCCLRSRSNSAAD